jgi:hypothetical protein
MSGRLAAPATVFMIAAAATAAAAISVLLRTPADVVLAASRGDLAFFWRVIVGAFADAIAAVLQYL